MKAMSAILLSPGEAIAPTRAELPQTLDSYPEEIRTRCLAIFAATNNVSLAATQCGIPRSTVWRWLQGDGAQEVVQRLRDNLRAYTAYEHVEIAMIAARQLKDRLTHGDPHVDKHGNVTLVPVKAKDLVMALSVSTDKAIMLGGSMADAKATDSRLDKLAADILTRVDKTLRDKAEADAKPAAIPLGDYLG